MALLNKHQFIQLVLCDKDSKSESISPVVIHFWAEEIGEVFG